MIDQTYVFPMVGTSFIQSLTGIYTILRNDPNALNNCRYPAEVIVMLRDMQKGIQGSTPIESQPATPAARRFMEGDDTKAMEERIKSSIEGLEDLETQIKTSKDLNDKLKFYKEVNTLIQKLVELKSEVKKIKEVDEFKVLIFSIIDNELNDDQRTRVMKALKEHVAG